MKHYAERIKEIALARNSLSCERICACIYARVSTDKEGQAESCQNQVDMAKRAISEYPNIELVEVFVDDGISGKSDFNRPEYNKMLKMIEDGIIKLIVVKDFSRLNRDQYNSLGLINLLRENKATILTLIDNNVHDLDDSNEAIFNSLSFVMDEKYSHDQQEKGRQTHEERVANKELSAKDVCYGYLWDQNTKTIQINEEEARIVKEIFVKYTLENKDPTAIAEEYRLKEVRVERLQRVKDAKGKKTSKRELVSSPLTSKSISRILLNRKYLGEFTINKLTTEYSRGKNSKRVKLPEDEWVVVERPDLQIIDRELFELAQRVRESRLTPSSGKKGQLRKEHFKGIHNYSHLIQCSECRQFYTYDEAGRKNIIPRYRTRNHSGCISPQNFITESDLNKIVTTSLNTIFQDKKLILQDLENVLEEAVRASQDNSKEVRELTKTIDKLNKQYANFQNALSFASPETIKDLTINMNNINEKRTQLNKELEYKKSIQLDEHFVKTKLSEIRKALKELTNFNDLNRERILSYIQSIILFPNGDITIYYRSGNIWKYTEENKDLNSENNIVGKTGQLDDRCSVPATYPTLPPP